MHSKTNTLTHDMSKYLDVLCCYDTILMPELGFSIASVSPIDHFSKGGGGGGALGRCLIGEP